MSEVMRRGVIVIDLVGGKVEIPTPNIEPVLKARKEELELVDKLEVATLKAWEAQEKLAKSTADQAAAQALEQQAKAQDKAAAASAQLSAAYQNIGSGVFRLARATVLLGSDSDESFQKMIRGLAYVQAGFDLFKGTTQIMKGLTAAEAALAAATAAETTATAVNTAAHTANAAAKTTSTAASLAAAAGAKVVAAVTNPLTLIIVGLTAVIMACVEAWDYFTESEAEATEKAKAHAAAARELIAIFQQQADAVRQVADLERESMDAAGKADSLRKQGGMANARGEVALDLAGNGGGEVELAYRKQAQTDFGNAANDLKAERDIRKAMLDQETEILSEKIKQIEAQDKLVASAQKQLDLEKDKVKAFQAQVGSLTKLEQKQLVEIRDKLKGGGDISRFEEELLEKNAGEQGRGIVDARRAKRGAAAGFDQDFFKGIEGASTGLDDAAKALKEAVEQLKVLTGGATSAAKIAELEQEKAALNQKYQEFLKEFDALMAEIIVKMRANFERITVLEISAAANAGQ